ncbi:MAG: tartrate-resistant acid phosphatase type 5 family protein [Candidatus Kapabacteria bacterium]|jgi:acid phosphatase|nr:tartrate-resistant acid phosphatase type 5 family protein [Candidatus Kapabacteria bacterium]
MTLRCISLVLLALALPLKSCTGSLPMLFSSVSPGAKTVANAKPTPPFRTESFRDSAAVRFLVVGDWGTGASFQKNVAAGMCMKAGVEKPEFIISTGDNIYNDGVISADDPQWKTKFEDIYTCQELVLPWYAILGNHDHRSSIQAQIDYHQKNPRWNMPDRYYQFSMKAADGTDIDIFAIDTDPLNRKDTAFALKQNAWLRPALAASKARWKLVLGHHMIRSHGGYGDQDYMIRWIKPLLDEFKVDLYMNGHDHDLQYLKAPEDHFYCLISGGGGGARNTAFGANTIFAATNGGFHYIAVTRSRIYIEFVDSSGKTIFASNITKSQN